VNEQLNYDSCWEARGYFEFMGDYFKVESLNSTYEVEEPKEVWYADSDIPIYFIGGCI